MMFLHAMQRALGCLCGGGNRNQVQVIGDGQDDKRAELRGMFNEVNMDEAQYAWIHEKHERENELQRKNEQRENEQRKNKLRKPAWLDKPPEGSPIPGKIEAHVNKGAYPKESKESKEEHLEHKETGGHRGGLVGLTAQLKDVTEQSEHIAQELKEQMRMTDPVEKIKEGVKNTLKEVKEAIPEGVPNRMLIAYEQGGTDKLKEEGGKIALETAVNLVKKREIKE